MSDETDEADATRWPTDKQVREVVREVHQRRERAQTGGDEGVTGAQPGAPTTRQQTPADRVQDYVGPLGHKDHWQTARGGREHDQ